MSVSSAVFDVAQIFAIRTIIPQPLGGFSHLLATTPLPESGKSGSKSMSIGTPIPYTYGHRAGFTVEF